MIARDVREAWRAMPLVPPETVTQGRPFVVISPHPDDESLGMGGIIAAARAAGIDVRVVIVSDGSRSHPNSSKFPRERLVALRYTEALEAARHLGLAANSVTYLDLPDAAVPTSGRAFDAAVVHLAAVADDCKATSVFVTWGHDPHCDHEAAVAMARCLRAHRPALAFWCYPIWGWHLEAEREIEDSPPRGFRVDIGPWLAAKTHAIAAHASQMTDLIDDDPEGFRFTPEKLAPFLQPVEVVFEMAA